MSVKPCDIYGHFGNEGTFARHMRQVRHMYRCLQHMEYVKAIHYVTKAPVASSVAATTA